MTPDPGRLADFWAAALSLPERRDGDDEVLIADAEWTYPRYTFQRVDAAEPWTNRLHIDLVAQDRVAEVQRLVGLGATTVRTLTDDASGVDWTVMTDPDGNEFCVTQ
jgi:predicted enzyme related to lactoylglutathione lyase